MFTSIRWTGSSAAGSRHARSAPVVAVAAVSMSVVMAGGAWLLGHVLGLGLVGVWLALAADEWLRGLLMAWRWHSGAWQAHARVAHRG